MTVDDDSKYQLQRRIDQVDAKIDQVDQKVEAGSRETKTGFDNLIRLLDERWKSMEQRYDMTGRQQQQSIDLLTGTVVRIEQNISATDTNISMLDSELKVHRATLEDHKHQTDAVHEVLRRDLDALINAKRDLSKVFWGAVITGVVGTIVYTVSNSAPL